MFILLEKKTTVMGIENMKIDGSDCFLLIKHINWHKFECGWGDEHARRV